MAVKVRRSRPRGSRIATSAEKPEKVRRTSIQRCGASLIAIDATSNQVLATLGTLSVSTATALSGTFRGNADTGFREAANALSTADPATRDLYLLNSQTSGSLVRVIGNL
jgi:hypothetical protein